MIGYGLVMKLLEKSVESCRRQAVGYPVTFLVGVGIRATNCDMPSGAQNIIISSQVADSRFYKSPAPNDLLISLKGICASSGYEKGK
jgi:hypothetical protein